MHFKITKKILYFSMRFQMEQGKWTVMHVGRHGRRITQKFTHSLTKHSNFSLKSIVQLQIINFMNWEWILDPQSGTLSRSHKLQRGSSGSLSSDNQYFDMHRAFAFICRFEYMEASRISRTGPAGCIFFWLTTRNFLGEIMPLFTSTFT